MIQTLTAQPAMAAKLENIRVGGHPLDAIFAPRSVAVFGAMADPQGMGRAVLQNLAGRPFVNGNLYTIGQLCPEFPGVRTRARIGAVPEPVDLAVIASPPTAVPDIIGECVAAGVRGAIIVSERFREAGAEGADLERWIMAEARQGPLRIIGPKSLGVIRPFSGLSATTAHVAAWPGNIAFLSESRALCTAILDRSLRERVGFSALVSVGSMLDVGWGELIDYLGNDPYTTSIVIYMKTIVDAQSFVSAACRVAPNKPIILLKAGRTESEPANEGARTASAYGRDQVLDAVFRRCGALRVRQLSDLFDMSEVLGKQSSPSGPRLAILTNAGGPALLATDALISSGGELARLSAETTAALHAILPGRVSHGNPVDLLDDIDPERFARAVEVVMNDPGADGLLLILAPRTMSDPTLTADRLRAIVAARNKPILASWMGGAGVLAGQDLLNKAGIPTFSYPDHAARAFRYMWKYSENLQSLSEAPAIPIEHDADAVDRNDADTIGQAARLSGPSPLDEAESRRLLAAHGLPTMPASASSAAEAVYVAGEVGYPVALKPLSKPAARAAVDSGFCRDLNDADAVRRAYAAIEDSARQCFGPGQFRGVTIWPMAELAGFELTVASHIDQQFGPVLHCGMGRTLTTPSKNCALGLPPLSPALARQLVERAGINKVLRRSGTRAPVDLAALEQYLVRFSHLIVEEPWIKEFEVMMLLTSAGRLLTLEASVVPWGTETPEDEWPRPVFGP